MNDIGNTFKAENQAERVRTRIDCDDQEAKKTR